MIDVNPSSTESTANPAPASTTEAMAQPATAAQPQGDAIASLRAENESLRRQLAAANDQLRAQQLEKDKLTVFESKVNAKVNRGLSRAQAIAVLKRQEAFEKSDHGRFVQARNEARQSIRVS